MSKDRYDAHGDLDADYLLMFYEWVLKIDPDVIAEFDREFGFVTDEPMN